MAFNGKFLLNMVHFARQKGAGFQELISETGFTSEELSMEDCVLDNETYNRTIEQAVKMSGDPYFGLHAGESMNLSAAGLIVQLVQTCKTVKQALDLCCQYANLGCSVLPMNLINTGKDYKLTLVPDNLWRSNSEMAFRQTVEGVLAFTIREFHSLTRMKHSPVAVKLPWEAPDNPSEYIRVFGCPVFYNKEEIAIVLNREHVEAEVISANYELMQVLLRFAEEKSAKISSGRSFSDLVKQSVVNLMGSRFPTLEQVAGHLHVSVRTLQRRLNDENNNFKNLTDQLRREFALRYIDRNDINISEIAYMLGYNEVSSFTRSFKRWTGNSPRDYRTA